MPTFPTYSGELPTCLNPLNPRHYLLVCYWIFFRPMALKCYLYQADEVLYKASGKKNLRSTLSIPTHRNLYIIALVLTILITLPFPNVNYFLLPFGVAHGVAFGVAEGVAEGVAGGVAGGVMFGLAGGGVLGMAEGVAFGVAISVALGVTVGVTGSIVFGVLVGIVLGMGTSTVFSVILGMAVGMATVIGFLLGSTRAIFYPFQWTISWKYPALYCDELLVLPLRQGKQQLQENLKYNETNGLTQLTDIGSNPFQRWLIQNIIYTHWCKHSHPLEFIQAILHGARLNRYVFAPAIDWQWEKVPDSRTLVLGELAGQFVNTKSRGEDWVWWLTQRLRDRSQPTLTNYARLQFELYLSDRQSPVYILNQDWAQHAWQAIQDLPDGQEIRDSFQLYKTFLNYNRFESIAQARALLTVLPPENKALRPKIIQALHTLGTVSLEVQAYQDSTSKQNKLAAIARATDTLETLEQAITTDVIEPDRNIFQHIIDTWRPLITNEGGDIGRFELTKPIDNPYVAGNPVTGQLFVGREDIMRELEAKWSKQHCDSVVLYGHRRMGKTSILQNLGHRFGQTKIIIDFNMQRVGHVENTGELLYNLAFECSRQLDMPELDYDKFIQRGYSEFNQFILQLNTYRQNKQLIVTVDEFEYIEQGIKEKRLKPDVLVYFRGIIQTHSWFVMAFAGLHTFEEMCHDYFQPFFGSVDLQHVSFLTHKAATQLITNPASDFPLDYDKDAVEEIIQLTGKQPYLIQLICENLVSRFNRQTFEEGKPREKRLTLHDVHAIINNPELFRKGNAYFTGVWQQGDEHQFKVLQVLAPHEEGLTPIQLMEKTELSSEMFQNAIKILKNHDTVQEKEGKIFYTVELMRRWVLSRL